MNSLRQPTSLLLDSSSFSSSYTVTSDSLLGKNPTNGHTTILTTFQGLFHRSSLPLLRNIHLRILPHRHPKSQSRSKVHPPPRLHNPDLDPQQNVLEARPACIPSLLGSSRPTFIQYASLHNLLLTFIRRNGLFRSTSQRIHWPFEEARRDSLRNHGYEYRWPVWQQRYSKQTRIFRQSTPLAGGSGTGYLLPLLESILQKTHKHCRSSRHDSG